jgi:hypothetical protein
MRNIPPNQSPEPSAVAAAVAIPPRVGDGSACYVRHHMTPQILQDFYDGRRSAAVPFVVNDTAVILRGVYAKRSGAVVAIDISKESPRFLIEFGDGTDELVSLDDLQSMTTMWPNQSPKPTAVGAAVAIHAASRRWLGFLR